MKRIDEGELYQHLGEFLKAKGIELKEGAYTKRIEQGCTLLSEVINAGQSGIEKARTKAEKKLEQLRQVIHEKTAPKPPAASASPRNPQAGEKNREATAPARKPRPRRKAPKKRTG